MADSTPGSWAPNGAAGTSAVSVAVSGLICWAVESFAGIKVPPDVQLEISILAAYVGTYIHPLGRR